MPAMATSQFIQGKITHINKLLLILYKYMYKVLPFFVQLGRYSFVKNNHCFFAKVLYYQVSGMPLLLSRDKIYAI